MTDFSYVTPKTFRSINLVGVTTLYRKEVMRFVKVYLQTLIAPVMTTLLFFIVFSIALGSDRKIGLDEISYLEFIAPGLIMMAMVQNAFANTSSSIMISKMTSSLSDILMPPLSSLELVSAFVFAAITRGLMVGTICILVFMTFVDFKFFSPTLIVYFGVLSSALLSLLGFIGGLWADKFDHIAGVTNFVVTPLTFLSGTFYSIARLPDALQTVSSFNPFFGMINGFRYGMTGYSDGYLVQGAVLLLSLVLVLFFVALKLVHEGYKIKT